LFQLSAAEALTVGIWPRPVLQVQPVELKYADQKEKPCRG
jgi:hypothetical protein